MSWSSHFMQLALQIAAEAASNNEVPVGAIIVDPRKNVVLAKSGNLVETNTDPCAHAEILAIQKASTLLATPRLIGYDLYVTLEPCPMCAYAISLARIDRLYFGAYDPKSGGIDHGPRLFHNQACHHRPEYYGGIMEQESATLLRNFFQQKR